MSSERDLLGMERIGPARFRTAIGHANFSGAIYGGQFLAQAIAAAARTVPAELVCHSQHAHFIRSGLADQPLDYDVTVLRDGRSALRRVAAFQSDRLLFEANCSFAVPSEGPSHSPKMPLTSSPDECEDVADYVVRQTSALPAGIVSRYAHKLPLERRLIDPDSMFFDRSDGVRMAWLRLRNRAAITGVAAERAMIAYMSDAWLCAPAFRPHFAISETASLRTVSLDHAVWIHASAPLTGWFLYVTDGPWAGSRRGFGRGQLFEQGGTLVASAAQEGISFGNLPEPR